MRKSYDFCATGDAGELRHVDGDFQDQRPQAAGVAEAVDVEACRCRCRRSLSKFSDARLHAVSSRNMYSEQLWTTMPLATKWCVAGSVRS